MKKSLVAGLGATALVASAATVALASGSPATAAGEPSSAFGIELTIAGNEVLARDTVAVESTDGALIQDELAALPVDPVVSAGLIEVEAENGHAKATVADLGVGNGLLDQLPPELTTALGDVCTQLGPVLEAGGQLTGSLNDILGSVQDQVLQPLVDALETAMNAEVLTSLGLGGLLPEDLSSVCDALTGEVPLVGAGVITAECNGDSGVGQVADLTSVLGLPVNVSAEPNSSLTIEGLVDLTVNRQTTNADGTFTVDALHLNLLGQIDLTVASATCGEVTKDAPPADEPDAPAPTPGPGNLPVTG